MPRTNSDVKCVEYNTDVSFSTFDKGGGGGGGGGGEKQQNLDRHSEPSKRLL